MAISLEELALGALEGSAGPRTLAIGADAHAVALAGGSARAVRPMVTNAAPMLLQSSDTAAVSIRDCCGGPVQRSVTSNGSRSE
jgi:hypothetical protein